MSCRDLLTGSFELRPITNNMNSNLSRYIRRISIPFFLSVSLTCFVNAQDNGDSEDDVYTLSPFSVDASENEGYRATNTLAGTRIKTRIKDIATAISVYTEAFLEDTASTNAEELLVYSAGTEVPGLSGNFANVSAGGAATINDDAARRNPEGSTRVRGLAAADLARDYFPTSIPFDTYNTESITINRGSNSILFGLGSPAGIINNDTKKAFFGDEVEMQFRFDSFGSDRTIVDINKELVEDHLAVRLILLNEKRDYKIKPAFERDERIYAALTYKPFGSESNTTIRAQFENGSISANRPRLSPPVDAFSSWWDPTFNNGAPTPDRVGANGRPFHDPTGLGYGVTLPDGTNISSASFFNIGAGLWSPSVTFGEPSDKFGDPALSTEPFVTGNRTFDPDGDGPIVAFPTNQPSFVTLRASALAGRVQNIPFNGFYQNKQITDPSIFNFNKLLLDGPNKSEWAGFDTLNVSLEQLFLNKKAGIEVAFDRQNFDSGFVQDIDGGRGRFITVDTNIHLQNGLDNPNFGRPFVTGLGSAGESDVERETVRLQAFYELDLTESFSDSFLSGFLGKNTFTGLVNDQSTDSLNVGYRRSAWGPERADFSTKLGGGLNNVTNGGRRGVGTQIYLGESFANASSPSGWNIQNPSVAYEIRDTETVLLFNELTQQFENHDLSTIQYEKAKEQLASGGNLGRLDVSSLAGTMQSRWLKDMVVTTVGYREDEATTFTNDNPDRHPLGYRLVDSANFRLPSDPSSPVSNTSIWSYGAVGHLPNGWFDNNPVIDNVSVHYSESENFVVSAARVDIAGQSIAPEGGATTEKGISMGLLEGKLFFKANWFTTSQSRITESGINPEDLFEWEARMIERAPGIIEAESDLRQLPLFANAQPFSNFADYVDSNTLLPIGYTQEFANFLGVTPVDANNDGYPDQDSLSVSSPPSGLVATSDKVASGFEFETVVNPSKNWTLMFNAVQQEVIRSGSALELQKQIAARLPIIEQFGDLPQAETGDETVVGRINRTVIVPIKTILAQNDQPLVTEIREWRWNLATNYKFSEGRLSGFGIGGGARWQDVVAIGYAGRVDPEIGETLDTDNPFFGPSELNLDLWMSYEKPVFGDKADWKIQLNIRNLEGDDDLIPTFANPNGVVAGWRIKEPRSFVLTNTISF